MGGARWWGPATAVLLTLLGVLAIGGGDLLPFAQSQIIPMYVYPSDIPGHAQGEQAWLDACSKARAGSLGPSYVVANVYDGAVSPRAVVPKPGDPATADGFADPVIATYEVPGDAERSPTIDPNYEKAIERCTRTTAVLGYVSTHYGTVPLGRPGGYDPATVLGQVDLWFRLYPAISGIFLDEVSALPSDGHASYYAAVRQGVDGTLVANVGTPPPTDWLLRSGADVIVMFENAAQDFASFTMPSWAFAHPPDTFAAIVHGATSTTQVKAICAKSRRQNVGLLYVTDGTMTGGNPYRGLPSPAIWQSLLEGC